MMLWPLLAIIFAPCLHPPPAAKVGWDKIIYLVLSRMGGRAMNHTIIHFDIPADNVEMLKGFYHQVFGWRTIDLPDMDYVMLHTVPTDEEGMIMEPGVNGGMYQRTSRSQVPLNYVSVESVDEYIGRTISAGGKVVAPKQYIPTVGDVAVISDPEGNPLGLIRPEM